MELTFLLGGVRAGKSAKALELAREREERGVLFVATAQALDDEMRQRIAIHQAERPARWETLETPIDIATEIGSRLNAAPARFGVVIIDCLTLWVSNVLLSLGDDEDAEAIMSARAGELITMLRRNAHVGDGARRWIVVSNEVGLGIVPPTSLGRRYRDALGRVNRMFAAAASDVTLMVAGMELSLKPRSQAAETRGIR
jgi:adenosyl cobinamide kinase/adenosyl cobinamide phosphate guanylyltransferase